VSAVRSPGDEDDACWAALAPGACVNAIPQDLLLPPLTAVYCAITCIFAQTPHLYSLYRFCSMNRIILALAALVGSASAFAPAVAPRPATQLQASNFDAGAKAAASLAASLALAGAVLTPDAAFAATATQAGGVCAAAPDSEVCRQSNQVKAKAAATAPKAAAKPVANVKPAAKKPAKKAPAKKKVSVGARSNGAFRSRR